MAFYCRACSLLISNGHCLHALIVGETVIAKPGYGVRKFCTACGATSHTANECRKP